MATVVDALIVQLGLDPRNFDEGKKKAASDVVDLGKTVESSSAGMVSALRRVGLEFTGLFFGIRGLGDIIRMFGNLSNELWHLGINAGNLGVAANELRDWQEVAELAGGKAEDATQAINGLQNAIFNMRFRGQISDQVEGLLRLGVNPFQGGKLQDFKALLFQVSSSLETRFSDQATRYQYASSYLGLTGGIATAVAEGPEKLRQFYEKAAEAPQITKKVTDSQAELNESIVALKYNVSGAAAEILDNVTPALKGLTDVVNRLIVPLKWIADLFTSHGTGDPFALNPLFNPQAGSPAAKFDAGLDKILSFFGLPTASSTRGIRNNNPLNLKATGDQEHDAQGFAVFATPGQGFSAAFSQLQRYATRGLNTIRGIVSTWAPDKNVAAYVAQVSAALGKSPDLPLTAEDYPALINAMARVESGSKVPQIVLPANPGALGAARGVGAASSATSKASGGPIASTSAGASTTVDIDTINVITQARDADRIAADLDRAMQRKFLVAHAEPGLA